MVADRRSRPGTGPFLRRVQIRNYKSIGKCDVSLFPFTVLVGRNGSGKSNFLDSLRFLADALQTSLDHAIKSRGGLNEVRRRSTGHPRNFALAVEFQLPDGTQASYGFEIAARSQGGFAVNAERLGILSPASGNASFVRRENDVAGSLPNLPQPLSDRLYLVAASGFAQFRPAYDALVSMGFYNLNPEAMKELQSPDAGELLHRDGSNVASVVARLEREEPAIVKRVENYLATIVPGIAGVCRVALGPRETLQFRQSVAGAKHPWKFYAQSMSDGTLRALGALIATSQLSAPGQTVSLVGIEEPESALHPAATAALVDGLREAVEHTQVVVTSHSPDLLDEIRFDGEHADDEGLLAVVSEDGKTHVAAADRASVEAIRSHLYSAGDLLRMDQIEVDRADVRRQQQMEIDFGRPVPERA